MTEQLTPNQVPDPYLVALSRRGTARKFRDKISQFFFGDDIFVSYARADATEYAASLAARLTKRKFICYLDQFGSLAEAEMPTRLKQKLMRSTAVVLIGTPNAVASMNVRKEIAMFTMTGRPIIPVNVDDTLLLATDWRELVGLAKIPEKGERVVRGNPSPRVVNLIKDSFRYRRRNQWQRLFLFAGAAFVVLAVGSASLWAGNRVAKANAVAATSEKKAGDAETKAATATVSEGKAKEAALFASLQEVMARVNTGIAAIQQKLAETGMQQAQLLELQGRERAAEVGRQEAGQRATVLSKVPGREFEALDIAVRTARQEFRQSRKPSSQVTSGLVAAVSATEDGLPLRGVRGEVTYAQISPNGQTVFVETLDRDAGLVRWALWDARTGKPWNMKPLFEEAWDPGPMPSESFRAGKMFIQAASFSGDGSRLVTLGAWQWPGVRIWDLKGEMKSRNIDLGNQTPSLIALDKDGSHLAVVLQGSSDIIVRQLQTGTNETFSNPTGATIVFIVFGKDNELLVVRDLALDPARDYSPQRELFAPVSKKVIPLGRSLPDQIVGLSTDDELIYSFDPVLVSQDKRTFPGNSLKIYLTDGQRIKAGFSGYSGRIAAAAVVDALPYVVTINGFEARIHGMRPDARSAILRELGPTNYAVLSPDGRLAATVRWTTTVTIWDVAMGRRLRTIELPELQGSIYAMAFSDDGKRLGLLGNSMVPEVLDVESGERLTPAPGKCNPVDEKGGSDYLGFLRQPRTISFLPDGEQFVTMHRNGIVAVWSIHSCTPVTRTLGDKLNVVAISVDGGFALTVGEGTNRSLKIWDLSNLMRAGSDQAELRATDLGIVPPGTIRAAWLSGGKARVLLSTGDWNLRLWRPEKKTALDLAGVDGEIYSAVFSPDGSKLSVVTKVGYDSGPVGVWDSDSGEKLITIPGNYEVQSSRRPITISSNGSYLVAALTDNTARIFPTSKEGFLAVAATRSSLVPLTK